MAKKTNGTRSWWVTKSKKLSAALVTSQTSELSSKERVLGLERDTLGVRSHIPYS